MLGGVCLVTFATCAASQVTLGGGEVLVPAVESIVPCISRSTRQVFINPPPGLLELGGRQKQLDSLKKKLLEFQPDLELMRAEALLEKGAPRFAFMKTRNPFELVFSQACNSGTVVDTSRNLLHIAYHCLHGSTDDAAPCVVGCLFLGLWVRSCFFCSFRLFVLVDQGRPKKARLPPVEPPCYI